MHMVYLSFIYIAYMYRRYRAVNMCTAIHGVCMNQFDRKQNEKKKEKEMHNGDWYDSDNKNNNSKTHQPIGEVSKSVKGSRETKRKWFQMDWNSEYARTQQQSQIEND